ncbi:hypothetical protein CPC08DRAFT_730385 [Agrocybe pediades]|nr:hypothetical protein CPC08DRAFT_730385 [Agrocybe pediades]
MRVNCCQVRPPNVAGTDVQWDALQPWKRREPPSHRWKLWHVVAVVKTRHYACGIVLIQQARFRAFSWLRCKFSWSGKRELKKKKEMCKRLDDANLEVTRQQHQYISRTPRVSSRRKLERRQASLTAFVVVSNGLGPVDDVTRALGIYPSSGDIGGKATFRAMAKLMDCIVPGCSLSAF